MPNILVRKDLDPWFKSSLSKLGSEIKEIDATPATDLDIKCLKNMFYCSTLDSAQNYIKSRKIRNDNSIHVLLKMPEIDKDSHKTISLFMLTQNMLLCEFREIGLQNVFIVPVHCSDQVAQYVDLISSPKIIEKVQVDENKLVVDAFTGVATIHDCYLIDDSFSSIYDLSQSDESRMEEAGIHRKVFDLFN